jgi:hypothetical protein
MTLGYKFSLFYIFPNPSSIRKSWFFVAFAQTPPLHFSLFFIQFCIFPISFNLFLLFILLTYRSNIIVFSLYLTWGESFSVVSLLAVVV